MVWKSGSLYKLVKALLSTSKEGYYHLIPLFIWQKNLCFFIQKSFWEWMSYKLHFSRNLNVLLSRFHKNLFEREEKVMCLFSGFLFLSQMSWIWWSSHVTMRRFFWVRHCKKKKKCKRFLFMIIRQILKIMKNDQFQILALKKYFFDWAFSKRFWYQCQVH